MGEVGPVVVRQAGLGSFRYGQAGQRPASSGALRRAGGQAWQARSLNGRYWADG